MMTTCPTHSREEGIMRSTTQLTLQYDMHNELKLRYREFFESRLAVFLLGKTELFSAVRKISLSILNYMESYKQKILKQLFIDSKIRKELYEVSYFGHLPHDESVALLPEKIVADIKATLQDEHAPLSQVMQIHSIFVYRLYDHLAEANHKQEVAKKYFTEDECTEEQGCNRLEREEKVPFTTQLGISKHPVFKKLTGQDQKPHARAIDRFLPKVSSVYCQEMIKHNLPFVAGKSGHTRTLLLGALLYGNFNSDEIKEYVLAIFVFLAAGGNHSFHEVMQVASKVGVPCDMQNYSVSLPSSFVNSDNYKVLSRIFPEYLDVISTSLQPAEPRPSGSVH
jgi:hypothetical protein